MPNREYARHALLGIAPPQSNPVVEAEMSALLPDGVGMLITRLTGESNDARSRFYEYIDNLPTSLAAFGKARIDAFGFSFTATAYMADVNQDQRLSAISQEVGYPIISSAQAIQRALDHLGAKRLALFSPYPDWLTELSTAYWTRKGYEVVSVATMPEDTNDTVTSMGYELIAYSRHQKSWIPIELMPLLSPVLAWPPCRRFNLSRNEPQSRFCAQTYV